MVFKFSRRPEDVIKKVFRLFYSLVYFFTIEIRFDNSNGFEI